MLSEHAQNLGERSKTMNQSGYCVSLATVFLGLTKYTTVPSFNQWRCGGSRASVSRGVT